MTSEIDDVVDLDGKTIAKAAWGRDGNLLLAFTDGTSCEVDAEYDEYDEGVNVEFVPIMNPADKVAAGLMTREQFDADRKAEQEQFQKDQAERQAQNDREEFARLKAKFEPASTPA